MPDESSRSVRTRRGFLVTAGAAGTVALAGCSGGGGDSNNSSNNSSSGNADVNFILNPASANVRIKLQYQPLVNYVEEQTGLEIGTKRAGNYNVTLQQIQRGSAELADTGAFGAVAARDALDIVGIRVAFGADKYFSLITTNQNNINSLTDLKGKTLAFADKLSTSGTLFPLKMLKRAGLDIGDAPQGDANDFTAKYSDHITARQQLINNPRVAAACSAAFSTGAYVPKAQFDAMSQPFTEIAPAYEDAGTESPQLDLLGVSEPIPRAPIVAREDWSGSNREEIIQTMLDAKAGGDAFTHDDKQALANKLNTNTSSNKFENHQLWFSNVKEGSFEDYQPVVEVQNDLGIQPGDLA